MKVLLFFGILGFTLVAAVIIETLDARRKTKELEKFLFRAIGEK